MVSTLSSLSALQTSHIDLWFIEPGQISSHSLNLLTAVLSPEEQHKIQQYKHKATQHIALISRGFLRIVLAKYTEQAANNLSFKRNKHGKPELVKNANNIRFNLSHNEQLIILSICVDDDIGCDIENPQRKISIEPLSRRFFAKQEHQQLITLNNTLQQQHFFELWTLKEAFVKATGIGIGLGLDSFYFEFNNKANQTAPIKVHFNEHYPLSTQQHWQCYQTTLSQQALAICRASKLPQNIIFINGLNLINES
jgi:4'-phosphopantetheinyl transferase